MLKGGAACGAVFRLCARQAMQHANRNLRPICGTAIETGVAKPPGFWLMVSRSKTTHLPEIENMTEI